MAGKPKREAKAKKGKQPKAARVRETKPRGPMHYLTAPLRRIAPVLAWGAALASGLTMPERMDLLELVIRSGIVWILTWLLCQVGASLAERLGELTDPNATSGTTTATRMESGDATA